MVQDKKILLVEDKFPMNWEKYNLKREESIDKYFKLKEAGKFKNKLNEEKLYYSKMEGEVISYLKPLLRENVKELEEEIGYKIKLSTSVEDAVKELEENNYNFVVTDLGLPIEKIEYQEEIMKKVQENKGKVKDKLKKLGVLEHFSYFEFICEKPFLYSGTIISSLAEKKNIKNCIFTNIDNHESSLLGAMLTGNIKPEVYPEIFKKLDVYHYNDDPCVPLPKGIDYVGYDMFVGLPKGIDFVKKDNIYVGKKGERRHFKEVLLDIIGRQV